MAAEQAGNITVVRSALLTLGADKRLSTINLIDTSVWGWR